MKKLLIIQLVLLTILNFSFAQTTEIVINDGTSIYVPLGAEMCADAITVNSGGSYQTEGPSGTCETDWTQKFPLTGPSARRYHAMAYIGGDQVLLFGGYDDSARDDETWIYDLSANTWTNMSPSSPPSARQSHAIAYIGGDQVLLFTGDDTSMDDETWVYDLSDNAWVEKSPSTKPSRRWEYAMAFIGGDQVLLFGGNDNSPDDETWVYDLSANTWINKDPSGNKPSARVDHAIAYLGGDQVLLFGGEDGSGQDDETWFYDLSDNTWTQKSPASKPPAREKFDMAYIGDDQVLLFGGRKPPNANDTWIYDLSANTWNQDANTIQPSTRDRYALSETSMDGSSYIVLFGGDDGGYLDDTWTFGGGNFPLPVELNSFTANVKNKCVFLEWETETEVDNYGFDVERKTQDARGEMQNWKKIGFVEGYGNSNSPKQYSFTDKNPIGGSKFQYRLKQIDTDGKFEYSDVVEVELIPNEFVLYQNYPNPFNPATTIKYALPIESIVKIVLYNSLGERITELVNELQSVGYQEAVWNASNVASGVYIYTLEAVPTNGAETFTSIKKMILLK
jgi:hypothetical protein